MLIDTFKKTIGLYTLDELLEIRDALDVLKQYDFEWAQDILQEINAELERRYKYP